ncbi:hypothetical protein RB623_26200 [Mesorhizobium sp. LHD-90]|uniref:hypothetical protein n=1 Tax=Mesorhizobium sp. LHD-90 TaxID=3071414 RepID=UPI0027E1B1DF|nr:hypothetical protein [Mesorhizobium sp. LHD-90]MDQ6437560.1 hypothetical protein [Mesorhizobium sp. LHD-90]
MSGYTLNGVAGRIRDLENKTNGGYYVALCWLAMARNSGKGARKLLETKIFGEGKPTSTFRNAWRIAEKSFAEGFHAGCRAAVAELALEEAITYAVDRLDQHKTTLGVSNMKDYEDVCKYASVETIPVDAPEPLPVYSTDFGSAVAAKSARISEPTPLEKAVVAMQALSLDEMTEFAKAVQARIVDLAVAQERTLKLAA